MRKRQKCIKCGIYFRDRKDPADWSIGSRVEKELCFNCRFIWQALKMFVIAIPSKINRIVTIRLDNVSITKPKKI